MYKIKFLLLCAILLAVCFLSIYLYTFVKGYTDSDIRTESGK